MESRCQYKFIPKACHEIPVEKIDSVDEETMAAFGLDFNVLPLFEKQVHDYLRMKNLSLQANGRFRCQWEDHVNNSGMGFKRKCKMLPALNDLHFYKYYCVYAPSQSLKGKNVRFHLSDRKAMKMRGNAPSAHETSLVKVRETRVLLGKRMQMWK